MKILTTSQIREGDQFTIQHEPITSIDLMERAMNRVTDSMVKYLNPARVLTFFIGPGNNGGDGLALARLLGDRGFRSRVYVCCPEAELSEDAGINFKRLQGSTACELFFLAEGDDFPILNHNDTVVDALFGSGLKKPLEGFYGALIGYLNELRPKVFAIDMPSGLFGEDNSQNDRASILRATRTFTLQFPKLAFFFPENDRFVGQWEVVDIGIHPEFIREMSTPYYYLNDDLISRKVKNRGKFAHKGIFGHAFLVAGSYGKMGAAILASKACLRTGVGLLTVHVPKIGYEIMQLAVPEAMVSIDIFEKVFSRCQIIENFSAIGIGPGIGKSRNSQDGFRQLLDKVKTPMVIDADALNILSENPDWLDLLPENSILTPHIKEFERMAGKYSDNFHRNQILLEFASRYKIFVVLKGANSAIACPDGSCYFNTTGNPGMATGGTGDVLTGILLSLLSQGYKPKDAVRLGVYLHGLAGDLGAATMGQEALLASDIPDYIGKAFGYLRNCLPTQ